MSMQCAVCQKGPAQGVAIFRMNEKGKPGLWACNEHKDQFDRRIPEEVRDIVNVLEGRRP